jgi:DNA segregation ATPase FtsK/SpoIIIE, S-DNA-T family
VVLGTPDAYHLPPSPGLAWLKVDSSVYHRFKGALVTSPRRVAATPGRPAAVLHFDPFGAAAVDDPLGPMGARVDSSSPRHGAIGAADVPVPVTDLEASVAALAAEGRRTGQAAHQAWLPPL